MRVFLQQQEFILQRKIMITKNNNVFKYFFILLSVISITQTIKAAGREESLAERAMRLQERQRRYQRIIQLQENKQLPVYRPSTQPCQGRSS